MTIKLSKPSKMPCLSWSLQALSTCPGSLAADGRLVDACRGCYATDGNYRFSNVIAPRLHNQEDWKREDWVSDMIDALAKQTHFRWFDSGDCYHIKLAHKILEVMKATSWVKHWMPTRMHKFAKFVPVLEAMQALDNVTVRYSSDSINGGLVQGRTISTIIAYAEHATETMVVCRAYERDGKCGDCRACWSKSVNVIAYVAHGRKMAKQIKINSANIIARG